jgi:hypothetical protein
MANPPNTNNPWRLWKVHPAAIVLLCVGGALALAAGPGLWRLKPPLQLVELLEFDVGAIVSMLLTLFVATLFVERAVEVIINAWREPGKRAIEEGHVPPRFAPAGYTGVLVTAKRPPTGTSPTGPPTGTTPTTAPLPVLEEVLNAYKAQTVRIAGAMTITLGVGLGLIGFRVLQPLVDSDSFAALGGLQRIVFNWTDILITGGIIGGGSEGIHRMISVITGAFETSKAWLDMKKREHERK